MHAFAFYFFFFNLPLLHRQGVSDSFLKAFCFDSEREQKTFLVDYFIFFYFSYFGMHIDTSTAKSFSRGGTIQMQVSRKIISVIALLKTRAKLIQYAYFNPNKHLGSLCLRPALKVEMNGIVMWFANGTSAFPKRENTHIQYKGNIHIL